MWHSGRRGNVSRYYYFTLDLAFPSVPPPIRVHPPAGGLLGCHGLAPAGRGVFSDHLAWARFPLSPPPVPHRNPTITLVGLVWSCCESVPPLYAPGGHGNAQAILLPARGLLRAGGSTLWGRVNEERRGQKMGASFCLA